MKNNMILSVIYFIVTFFSIVIIIGCNDNKTYEANNPNKTEAKQYIQVDFKVNLNTPTVGINNYTLITNDLQRDSSDAQAIIRAKVILPLAMQKHSESLFDSVLSKDFISQGEGEFFKQERIHPRSG